MSDDDDDDVDIPSLPIVKEIETSFAISTKGPIIPKAKMHDLSVRIQAEHRRVPRLREYLELLADLMLEQGMPLVGEQIRSLANAADSGKRLEAELDRGSRRAQTKTDTDANRLARGISRDTSELERSARATVDAILKGQVRSSKNTIAHIAHELLELGNETDEEKRAFVRMLHKKHLATFDQLTAALDDGEARATLVTAFISYASAEEKLATVTVLARAATDADVRAIVDVLVGEVTEAARRKIVDAALAAGLAAERLRAAYPDLTWLDALLSK